MGSTQPSSSAEALSSAQNVWDRLKNNSPIYQFLLSDIELVDAEKAGSITAHLAVKPVHLNSRGTLHGTVSACLTDWAGGLAVAATGLEKTGVSTDIHTTYVSTAKEGDILEVVAKAQKVGGTLAFTTVEIKKITEDGKSGVVATGSHTKYVKQ